jgi:hypothetical protein
MDPNDRQRFKILFILLAVLAATVWVGRETYQVLLSPLSVGDAPIASEPDRVDALATGSRAADRLSDVSVLEDGPRRNPFQYGSEPTPQASLSDEYLSSTPEPGDAPQAPGVVALPPSPPPPPIPFGYNGYAFVDQDGEIKALLFDSERSFVVSAQDVVMGRYGIRSITEEYVEVEDLEFERLQRLPLITQ